MIWTINKRIHTGPKDYSQTTILCTDDQLIWIANSHSSFKPILCILLVTLKEHPYFIYNILSTHFIPAQVWFEQVNVACTDWELIKNKPEGRPSSNPASSPWKLLLLPKSADKNERRGERGKTILRLRKLTRFS